MLNVTRWTATFDFRRAITRLPPFRLYRSGIVICPRKRGDSQCCDWEMALCDSRYGVELHDPKDTFYFYTLSTLSLSFPIVWNRLEELQD